MPLADFPDAPQLLQLQDDLWKWPRSRAALMVGAGFSRNSIPAPGGTPKMPLWGALVRAMFNELYPPGLSHDKKFDASSYLRIASEYEAAFGEARLVNLMRTQMPDSKHSPGRLHEKLLKLPWRDVFTTNYDTLLERTEVNERFYQCVTDLSQLATTTPPRIIKLHGSFSTCSRLVITEEDYRKYPKDSAGFVNTVQQSLLENCFVLVGFSGEDPNFLSWIGWIRDELGDKHAPIYLVGLLRLGVGERLFMERRGVKPIDLAPLFSTVESVDKHEASIEWFLDSLEAARPSSPDLWPKLDSKPKAVHAPPLLYKMDDSPAVISIDSLKLPTHDERKGAFKRWEWERSKYPGWIIPPESKRDAVWFDIDGWLPRRVLEALDDWNAVDRLLFFRELNWRIELAMAPLFGESVSAFGNAVNAVYEKLVGSEKIDCTLVKDPSKADIAVVWLEVAFGLLRESREMYNKETWSTLVEKIEKIVGLYKIGNDRLSFEKILWSAWNVEVKEALKQIRLWCPEKENIIANLRKAGLLAELNELEESKEILRSTLTVIRRAQQDQGKNRQLLSLEGWCTFVICLVEGSQDFGMSHSALRDEFRERWQELSSFDCSPWQIMDEFRESLSGPKPLHESSAEIRTGFDPGSRSVTHRFANSAHAFLPAFAFVRLYEQAGIPIKTGLYNVDNNLLKTACEWIVHFILPSWSPAILVRACKIGDLADESSFLSRTEVASMDEKLAKWIYLWCFTILENESKRVFHGALRKREEYGYLASVTGLMSKLSIRLNANELQSAFDLALKFYSESAVRSNRSLLSKCLVWFERLFEAVEDRVLIEEWIPSLLALPLCSDAGGKKFEWEDPLIHIDILRLRKSRLSSTPCPRLDEAAELALKKVLIENDDRKEQLLFRLARISLCGLLSEKHLSQFAKVLWSTLDANGLPAVPDHCFGHYIIFLRLPHPADKDVVAILKKKILALTPSDGGSITIRDGKRGGYSSGRPICDLIAESATCTSPFVNTTTSEIYLEWDEAQVRELLKNAIAWWNLAKDAFREEDHPMINLRKHNTAHYLGNFITKVVMPIASAFDENDWSTLLSWLEDQRNFGIHASMSLPCLLIHKPELESFVREQLVSALNSEDEDLIYPALEGLICWTRLRKDNLLSMDCSEVFQALIDRISFRNCAVRDNCMACLAHIIAESSDLISPTQFKSICRSLPVWLVVTTNALAENGRTSYDERLHLRQVLATLAGVLQWWHSNNLPGEPLPESIRQWQLFCEQETLPEVRRAFGKGLRLHEQHD